MNEKRLIQAEDLYDFEIINTCQISPDGKKIVYSLQTVDRESEKKYSHLWIVASDGGKPIQMTFGKQSDTNPQWSPDGKWITFMSNRSDKDQAQIFLLPTTGGEAHALTDLHGDFGEYDWSPNSQKLVFQFRQHDPEDIERQKDEKKKELGRVSRRITDRVFYKLDGHGYLPKARYHLWTVDIESGNAVCLFEDEIHDEEGPVWSPDGKSIAFFSNRTEQPDLNPDLIDLFIYNLESQKFRKIQTPQGFKRKANFSPNGKLVAYIGREGLKADYKNDELWVVDIENESSAVSLTSALDFDVGGGVINDIGSFVTSKPYWTSDGRDLVFQVGQHGRASLHKIGVDGDGLETLIKYDGVVSGFSIDAAGDNIGYIHGSFFDPCQIGYYTLNDSENQILTNLNKYLLESVDLGVLEEVWCEGNDGNALQGWILKPPGFDPVNRYPSVLEIHGGPLAQYGYFFMHEFFYLAAQGYVVYFCNPRGGQGYGEEHAKAIYHGRWGTVDYEDLMVWADKMEALPYIDSDKMGVTGGSYGGYMTVWIIGHTDRFIAAVSQRCVSNLISMWGSSDFNWSFQQIFDDKAPYENLDVLWQCSPIKHIGSATTPTLIIHSQQDLRCAIEQSEQVYVALRNLGVESEFLIFPDSPHGISRMGRTDRRVVRLRAIGEWFERYLGD
jgi:dipeptidyl aminopeptidase/acylaminoacyl peptidase